MHRAEFLDLEPLQIKSFLKDLFPPEAEVRGSNPLGRASKSNDSGEKAAIN